MTLKFVSSIRKKQSFNFVRLVNQPNALLFYLNVTRNLKNAWRRWKLTDNGMSSYLNCLMTSEGEKLRKILKIVYCSPVERNNFLPTFHPIFFFFLFCFCSPVARDKIDVPLSVKVCYSFHRKHNELISSFMSHFKMSASFIRLKKKRKERKKGKKFASFLSLAWKILFAV